MVTRCIWWGWLLATCAARLCAEELVRVEVEVSGLRGTNGSLRVGLFMEAGFPRDESRAVTGAVAGVTGAVTVVTVGGVSPGEYAVLVYHDQDGDGHLDFDILGRPREGYGVSGGARRTWRAPRYEEARIPVRSGSGRIRVSLAY